MVSLDERALRGRDLAARAQERQKEELPPMCGAAQGHAVERGQVGLGGPQQDGRRSGRRGDLATGRAPRELLGDDRDVRELRHDRPPLTRMVCYAGL